MKISVIGLGSMGLGAAVSCLKAGHTVVGIDLNPVALDNFAQHQGHASDKFQDIARSDILLVFVVNAAQADDVLSDEHLALLADKACVVNCVTLPPAEAVRLAERVEAAGLRYLDAPVSGGAAKAMLGEMSVMASGSAEAFAAARPALDAIASRVFELGDRPGAGSQMKTINQLLAGVHIAAAAESMVLAKQMGLDLHHVIDVISECAGTSWMFENRAPHIADGDYTPLSTVDIFVKDLGIVQQAAGESGAIPLTRAALKLYQQASAQGNGKIDDSGVALLLAEQAGVTLERNKP